MTRFVDMTPTWGAVMPAFFAIFECGTAEGQAIAREELTRLAAAARIAPADMSERAACIASGNRMERAASDLLRQSFDVARKEAESKLCPACLQTETESGLKLEFPPACPGCFAATSGTIESLETKYRDLKAAAFQALAYLVAPHRGDSETLADNAFSTREIIESALNPKGV